MGDYPVAYKVGELRQDIREGRGVSDVVILDPVNGRADRAEPGSRIDDLIALIDDGAIFIKNRNADRAYRAQIFVRQLNIQCSESHLAFRTARTGACLGQYRMFDSFTVLTGSVRRSRRVRQSHGHSCDCASAGVEPSPPSRALGTGRRSALV